MSSEKSKKATGLTERFKIFSGNANRALAEEICGHLGVPLGAAEVGRFSDGELRVKISENVRGDDVFVVQPTCPPVNDHLMEMLIMVDALARASARRITLVMPYYGYARQDRKAEPRVPITAKLVANLIVAAGADRVLSMDLHAGQIQGFFDIPVDHLYGMPVFLEHIRRKKIEGCRGGVARCGRRGTRARVRQTAGRGSGHHRQTPAARECGGRDERDRRCAQQNGDPS